MSNFKAPICSIMGHVDAGKTSLIDYIKKSNKVKDEAGGITQTISSSYIDIDSIVELTKVINGKYAVEPTIPGMLLIDTPGHEAFNVMRENGSTLCDIAFVIIDIMDGVKPQTIESVKMLKKNKVPFVIVASKLDTIPDYNKSTETSLRKAFKHQSKNTITYITSSIEDIKYDFDKIGCKSEFYFHNKKPQSIYSIVPVSSHTGEGMADLMALIVYISQNWMNKKITYSDNIEGQVMNNYKDKNKGWIIDIILKNGTLNNGDKLIFNGYKGPKVVTIRNMFVNNKQDSFVKATNSVSIMGSNCDDIYIGTQFYKFENNIEMYVEQMTSMWTKLKLDNKGIIIMAPTIGAIDAFYKVFKKENIPIKYYLIGELTDKNLNYIKTHLIGEEHLENRVVLYFGELTELQKTKYNTMLKQLNIIFMQSDIIYHLLETYMKYRNDRLKERQDNQVSTGQVVFPCELQIYKDHIYMKGGSDNLLFGVKVRKGKLRIGSTLIVLNEDTQSDKELVLGTVTSIQKNNEDVNEVKLYDEVCIRLNNPNQLSYERHFNHKNKIIAILSRDSIDILKRDYRDIMLKEDWMLVIEHMNILGIKRNNTISS